MVNLIAFFTFLFAPHAAVVTPPAASVHAVAVVAPAPAQIPPEATTTTTTLPPAPAPAPVLPAQPSAETDLTGLQPGQCAITWNSVQTNPVTGQSGVVTSIYRGDCGEAQTIANSYPGAIVVTVPTQPSADPGCYEAGDCTGPTMAG